MKGDKEDQIEEMLSEAKIVVLMFDDLGLSFNEKEISIYRDKRRKAGL